MPETMYLLDFRRGIVETVDPSVPPEGISEARAQREGLPQRTGYVLAALGSPPEPQEE